MHNTHFQKMIKIWMMAGLVVSCVACAGTQTTEQTSQKIEAGHISAAEQVKAEVPTELKSDEESFQDNWDGDSDYADLVDVDALSISVRNGGYREDIQLFQGEDDAYYFFLPTYASTSKLRMNVNPDQYDVMIDGEAVIQTESFPVVKLGTPVTLSLKNKETGEEDSRQVCFMQSAHINTMYITTESGSLDYIHEDKENKESGTMTLFTDAGAKNYDGALEYISGRGNQTWDLDKRPYQIKLDKKEDLLNMGKAKKWILLANTLDETFIRNKIVYDMADAMGLPYSPQSEFIDLYVNGIYMGNYQICEKIEIDSQRVDIKNLEKETEDLNKDIDFKNFEIHEAEDQNEKWIDMINNPEDITGGYLLERDYWEKYGPERSGFKTNLREHFVIKSPENASRAEVEYIRAVVQQIEDAIYAEDGINPTTGIYYTDYIDLESWVKKYMIEEITKNEGAGTTSSWFYKPAAEQSNQIYAGPVWDYDKSLGRYEVSCYQDPFGLSYLSYHHYSSPWYKQLYSHDDFLAAVKQYYQEEYQTYLRNLTDEKIDQYANIVRASAAMDHTRWSELSEEWLFTDFDEGISYLKDFVQKRTDFLDEVWVDDKVYYMVKLKVEGAVYEARYLEPGEKLTDLPDLSDKYDNAEGWYYEDTDEPYMDGTEINEDIALYLKMADD